MENLLTSKKFHETVPERFIFPPEKRVGIQTCPTAALPVIDLQGGPRCLVHDRDQIIGQILRAGEEVGFFQVINHGVSEQVMKDMLELMEDFFNMSMEDKIEYYSDDQAKGNRLFSVVCTPKRVPNFGEIALDWCPILFDESINEWPQKPIRFREVVARFVAETRDVLMMLQDLICQGLGLKEGYFSGDLTGGEMPIHVNYYPTCPNPDLTLGVPAHFDNNIITLLLSGTVRGLQIKHEGNWIGVEPVPNAFAINIGQQIEIITNGMLRSVEHRAITNAIAARTSVAVFLSPKMDVVLHQPKNW